MTREYPRFAVVGHPNKGKSSIVSTLAQDETVQISDTPGTTKKYRAFPLKVDGEILYELYDTPGFQRARALLEWLKEVEVSADKKADRVRRFVYEHRDNPKFADEVQLLKPILDGAGIIYVVDGSKPYGVEYEAEMEILRWCGEPSMALINLIDSSDYVDEWKRALGHYFRLVRVFDPMKADFAQHVALLEGVAQLREEWTQPVKRSIEIFKAYREQKITQSAQYITDLMVNSLEFVASGSILGEEATQKERDLVVRRYEDHLRSLEIESHRKIAKIWHHALLESEPFLPLLEGVDLFSRESASIFGLSRQELITTGAAGGAVTGAGVDLLLGGSSLMMGSAIGALIGGIGAAFGFAEAAQIKVLGQTVGSRELEVGPMQNRNFPYMLLHRALYYAREIASRPHANRKKITIDHNEIAGHTWEEERAKKRLEEFHGTLRKGEPLSQNKLQEYQALIKTLLANALNS